MILGTHRSLVLLSACSVSYILSFYIILHVRNSVLELLPSQVCLRCFVDGPP